MGVTYIHWNMLIYIFLFDASFKTKSGWKNEKNQHLTLRTSCSRFQIIPAGMISFLIILNKNMIIWLVDDDYLKVGTWFSSSRHGCWDPFPPRDHHLHRLLVVPHSNATFTFAGKCLPWLLLAGEDLTSLPACCLQKHTFPELVCVGAPWDPLKLTDGFMRWLDLVFSLWGFFVHRSTVFYNLMSDTWHTKNS